MYFIRFLWPELIGAVSAWNTHSHHVLDSGRWWYGHNHSIWAICIRFAKPTFHFSLSFTNLVIICGAFEFNAGASVLFVIICYNDVRLSFHISFAPSVDTFFWYILFLTKPSSHDSLRIKTPDVLHYFAVKIGIISHLKLLLCGLSNSLFCPYFLIEGSIRDVTQCLNFLAVSKFEDKTRE